MKGKRAKWEEWKRLGHPDCSPPFPACSRNGSESGAKRVLSRIDLAIRVAAAMVASMLGIPMLLLTCIMATDSGTTEAYKMSAIIFVVGISVLGAISVLAAAPKPLEKRIPGPSILGQILVRLPTYPFGTVGLVLLLRQIWQVAIPDLLGR